MLHATLLMASALAAVARHTPPRLLLYTPLHVSEPTEAVRNFAACLFGNKPSLHGLKFDILISVSGAQPDGRDDIFKRIIAEACASANVAVSFTAMHDDTYALALSNDHRKGEAWVSGPNDAFYGAFSSGPVYESYVSHYDLVQQLETDVCAMADGWLDVLVEPMVRNPHLLISGARTACDCVYDAIHDVCEPMDKHGDHMTAHVNGNAVYRVGKDLETVLSIAQATYGNTEPFDLAVYWTLQKAGMLSRLHINPRYLNTPCLVDRARFTLPSYHAVSNAVAIHAPRRLRTTSLQAVASRGLNRGTQSQRKLFTLTVVGVTDVDGDVLAKQQAAFTSRFVDGVVYVAADHATYNAASQVALLRVVAAFGNSGGELGPVSKPLSGQINHHTPIPALESWPPSPTSAGSIMTAVARMVTIGHDVFLVGTDAVPLANYGGTLAGLERTAVHVAGLAEASSLPSMIYMPSSQAVAAFADAWALALRQNKAMSYDKLAKIASHHDITLTLLPWPDFVVRGPLLASGWPGVTLKRRSVVAFGSGDIAFLARSARAWPRDARVTCTNYSVLSRRPVKLTSATAARVIARYTEFASFVATRRVACVVIPGFVLPVTRSRVDVGSAVDLATFVKACGNTTLLPSRAWIEPGGRRVKFTRQHTRSAAMLLPLSWPLQSALHAALARLGPSFTCVRDVLRSPDEVAALRLNQNNIESWINTLREHHAIAHNHTLLLTSAWKIVRAQDMARQKSASLLTLADVAGGDEHPRLLTPKLATTSANMLLDPAWANVVEGLVCARHASFTVDTGPVFPKPQSLHSIITTMLPHIPAATLRRDLDTLRRWFQRSDRVKLTRPPIAILGPSSPSALATLLTLADMHPSRAIVLPFADTPWPDTTYMPPNVVPPSVLALALPRLALMLTRLGALTVTPDPQSARMATAYPAELTLIKRWARSWASAVVWMAPGNATLTDALTAVRMVPPGDAVVFTT